MSELLKHVSIVLISNAKFHFDIRAPRDRSFYLKSGVDFHSIFLSFLWLLITHESWYTTWPTSITSHVNFVPNFHSHLPSLFEESRHLGCRSGGVPWHRVFGVSSTETGQLLLTPLRFGGFTPCLHDSDEELNQFLSRLWLKSDQTFIS